MRTILFTLLVSIFIFNVNISAQENHFRKLDFMKDKLHIDMKKYDKSTLSPYLMQSFSANEYKSEQDQNFKSGKIDTLREHLNRCTRPWCYFYTDPRNGRQYPITGSNTLFWYLGQKFRLTGQAALKGVLIPFSVKILVEEPDTFDVMLCSGNENGDPVAQIAVTSISIDDIDTSRYLPVYNFIPIPEVVSLPSVFLIFIETRKFNLHDDGLVIWSNSQGDGNHENGSCVIVPDEHFNPVFANMADLPMTFDGQPIDLDILMLPVVDIASGIDDDISINGMTLKGLFPNPANEKISFDLSIENPENFEFKLLSARGEVVKELNNSYLSVGDYHFNYDLRDIPSGNYFLAVKGSNTKFAVNLRIIK